MVTPRRWSSSRSSWWKPRNRGPTSHPETAIHRIHPRQRGHASARESRPESSPLVCAGYATIGGGPAYGEQLCQVAQFAQYLDYDRSRLDFSVEGAELEFRAGPSPDQPPVEYGRVIRSVPPKPLEYTWGEEALCWELAPDSNGGCRLAFTNLFTDPEFAPFSALGWHIGLDRLGALLDDLDPATISLETDETAATELQQQYEESFG